MRGWVIRKASTQKARRVGTAHRIEAMLIDSPPANVLRPKTLTLLLAATALSLAALPGCKKEAGATPINGGATSPKAAVGPGPIPGQLFTEITAAVGFNENPPKYPDGT